MGVHGLWRLIEPSGKPVALETLENKVLAVDVSIWLHQAVKGFQDSKGAPIPNSHLLGIYHRVCKLLYFKIKPVFIFDGGVPVLKKQTIAKRNQQKSRNVSEAEKLQRQLLSTLLKHSAISKVLSEKTKASLTLPEKKTSKHENMYALPASEFDSTISSSEEEDMESVTDTSDKSNSSKHWDLHTIDMSSADFKNLPVDVRHEVLTELKETRKQSSWGRLHELPKQSDDFSSYQMKRLLKRQAVQSALEDAEKEMGGHSLSLAELESILKDHGVATTNDIGKRIASDENTRYLYIKNINEALEKARKDQQTLESIQEENNGNGTILDTESEKKTKADLELEEDLEKAIALSLQEEPSTSKSTECSNNDDTYRPRFSFLENFNDGDFESDDDVDTEMEEVPVKTKFSSAQSYMMEYSGLTPNEINKILNEKKGNLLTDTVKNQKVVEESRIEIISYSNDNSKNDVDKTNLDIISGKCPGKNKGEDADSNTINENKIDLNIHPFDEKEVMTAVINTKTNDIDTLSTKSDSSSYEDFEEISEVITSINDKGSMEIVIDPNKKLEDDLFSDVFNKHVEQKEADDLGSVIQSQSKLNTNDEVFDKEENSLDKNKTSTIERSVNQDNNVAIRTDENKLLTEDLKDAITSNQDVLKKTHEIENFKETSLINQADKKDAPAEIIRLQNGSEVEIRNLDFEEMTKLKNDLQKEKIDILVEKSNKERMANNITDQMYQEAQDLLELFGVPYIIAPMEAEAQCAFLDAIELTDGTITDDSDIWLFGGRTVYKNFFNQSKYVMEFKVENIKHTFKLTREQMILLALLVGSDYTIGLQGVGPVTALEILAAFPPTESKEFSLSHAELLSGLKEFRSWFIKGKSEGPGRSTLKNKLKNIAFADSFPSLQVVQAYLEPSVETSREKFSWSKPDFVGLTDFAKEKFGWSSKKTEEILKPVIKRVEEHQSQKSIKDYFKTVSKANSEDAQNQMSKRVRSAINRIGKTPQELIEEEMKALSKEKQKRSRKKKNCDNTSESKAIHKNEETHSKPKRMKKKNHEDGASSKSTSKETENIEKIDDKLEKTKSKTSRSSKDATENKILDETKREDDTSEDLKKYEDIAMELKKRRQRRNDFLKDKALIKNKSLSKKKPSRSEIVPQDNDDEEIELLKATTSMSKKRIEEINQNIKNNLEQEVKIQCLPSLHKKEVIHQKLRDKSDLLKNKLKAIEVYRKSKKGPGYIAKREKKKVLPKEDAELSENSSDE